MAKVKGRPRKTKIVRITPKIRQFSPRGIIGRPGYIAIKCEEMEAIRLSDFSGINQREAAMSMKISQQTFSRLLRNGRKCLAEALVMGRIIRIEGGSFKIEK